MKKIKLIISSALFICAFHVYFFSSIATAKDSEATKDQKMAVLLIQTKNDEGGSSGTGFACTYKGQEFVATNIHVIEGASSLSIRPQSGENIRLSGKVIIAEDADICLLGIVGEFKELELNRWNLWRMYSWGQKWAMGYCALEIVSATVLLPQPWEQLRPTASHDLKLSHQSFKAIAEAR